MRSGRGSRSITPRLLHMVWWAEIIFETIFFIAKSSPIDLGIDSDDIAILLEHTSLCRRLNPARLSKRGRRPFGNQLEKATDAPKRPREPPVRWAPHTGTALISAICDTPTQPPTLPTSLDHQANFVTRLHVIDTHDSLFCSHSFTASSASKGIVPPFHSIGPCGCRTRDPAQ